MLARLFGEREPVLDGERVRLRPARNGDYEAWAQLRRTSHDFLQPWEPTWPTDDLTRDAFAQRVRLCREDMRQGWAYPFLVFRLEDGALTGGITLSNVRRGVAQTATVGYWCGAPFARTGLTLDAVRTAAEFAFGQLDLHRLEAACLPENTASAGLLERAGFTREGLARQYLRINGSWRDHLLFGRLRADPG